MDLVEVYRNEVYCESKEVSERFGIKHSELRKTINKLVEDLKKSPPVKGSNPKIVERQRSYGRGQKHTVYLISRHFFTLLVMRLRSKDALMWQQEYIAAFDQMAVELKKALENKESDLWAIGRRAGIDVRHLATDAIKLLVDLSFLQSGKEASYYYGKITNAVYRSLGLQAKKKIGIRCLLNSRGVSQIQLLEGMIVDKLPEYVNSGMHHSKICKMIEDDIAQAGLSLISVYQPKLPVA